MSKFIILLFLISAGCSKYSDSYYPLNKEITWIYQITISGFLIERNTVEAKLTNMENRDLNGKKVIPQKLDIRNQSYLTFISENSEGIFEVGSQEPGMVEPNVRNKPNYYIKYPIQIGNKWEYETKTSLLNEVIQVKLISRIENVSETVTVPAETFKNCLKIKSTGTARKKIGLNSRESQAKITHYYWYAPGIGNIKSIYEEKGDFFLAGGIMTVELKSFKK